MAVITCFAPLFSNSQNALQGYNYRLFTSKDGLCNNHINHIVKDKNGFMWLATDNGLSRFDGNSFTNYYHEQGNPHSLGHNFVYNSFVDNEGTVWVGHAAGISRFENDKQQFVNYNPRSQFPGYKKSFFPNADDGKGNIWIASGDGLLVLNKQTGIFSDLDCHKIFDSLSPLKNQSTNSFAWSIYKAGRNILLINTGQGLFKYSIQTGRFSYEGMPIAAGVTGCVIAYADTANTTVYFGTYNRGLIKYNYQKKMGEPVAANKQHDQSASNYYPLYCFQPFGKRYVFITDLAIGFYEQTTNTIQPSVDVYGSGGITKSNIRFLDATDTANIWLATENGLLNAHKPLYELERQPLHFAYNGSFGNLVCLRGEDRIYTQNFGDDFPYLLNLADGSREVLPTAAGRIKGGFRRVYRDINGNRWLSTETEVYMLAAGTKRWNKIPVESMVANGVLLTRNFEEDDEGNLWLRVRNAGLFVFDQNRKIFIRQHVLEQIKQPELSTMLFDKATGQMYVSEKQHGIYSIATSGKDYIATKLETGEDFLPEVFCLQDGNLCMADNFNGLLVLNMATKQKQYYAVKDGLSSNACQAVLPDAQHGIWTYSTEGISYVNTATGNIVNVQSDSLYRIQDIAMDAHDHLLISTATGIFKLNMADVRAGPVAPTLYWKSVKVMRQIRPLPFNMPLSHYENDIEFVVGARQLQYTPDVQFEYRVNTDTSWHDMGSLRTISFSRLAPGNYTLQVRSKSYFNKNILLTASWRVNRPFWQSAWFVALLFLVVILLIWTVYNTRIKAFRKKALLEKQKLEAESKALRAQMNPHFVFNTLNSINNFIQKNDSEKASDYLSQFSRMMRLALDNSEEKLISLSRELETVRLYLELEQQRVNNRFSFDIVVNDVDADVLMVPPLIIQPYAENAIWHGLIHTVANGRLLIEVLPQTERATQIVITDNGVGRAVAAAHSASNKFGKSYGSRFTSSRIKLAKSSNEVVITDLVDDRGQPAGTRVSITLFN